VCYAGDDEILFECSDEPTIWVALVECTNYCDMRSCPEVVVEDEDLVETNNFLIDTRYASRSAADVSSSTKSHHSLYLLLGILIVAVIALIYMTCQYFRKRHNALEENLLADNYSVLSDGVGGEHAIWGANNALEWNDIHLPFNSDSECSILSDAPSDVPCVVEHRESVDEFMMNLDPPENPL